MAPSRISSVGMWGRKSLPTKKHMKTKSSKTRSLSTRWLTSLGTESGQARGKVGCNDQGRATSQHSRTCMCIASWWQAKAACGTAGHDMHTHRAVSTDQPHPQHHPSPGRQVEHEVLAQDGALEELVGFLGNGLLDLPLLGLRCHGLLQDRRAGVALWRGRHHLPARWKGNEWKS